MSEREVVIVERYDPLRNEVVDLTERAGISRRESRYSNMFHMPPGHLTIVGTCESIPESVTYKDISVEWGVLGYNQREEEVEKTLMWGNKEVRFVTWWTIRYQIAQPINITVK